MGQGLVEIDPNLVDIGRYRSKSVQIWPKSASLGAHQRWDADGLGEIKGAPWCWTFDAEVQAGDLRVRFLAEDEKQICRSEVSEGENMFIGRNFVESASSTPAHRGMPGFQAVVSGASRQGYSEKRRPRM